MEKRQSKQLLTLIGPGLLVAATGVGAGDLATAAFTGSQLGTTVLWAAVVGAFLKFVLSEGLTRWQLATGTTLLEGALQRLGLVVACFFLPYLFLWTFFVGAALMSACGVTLHAMLPVFADAATAKIVFGIGHSLLGLALVLAGGYRLFEKLMSLCVGIMFVTAVVTAALLWPGTAEVLRGLLPDPSTLRGEALTWTVALMGGVGGTLTILSYGYWIREEGRLTAEELPVCRVDLALGYGMTAFFGVAMVIIGTTVTVEGSGANLVVALAERLQERLGPVGKWAFLLGAWAAVFTSLFGVWQAVPYLFADFWEQLRRRRSTGDAAPTAAAVDTRGRPYRVYLFLIAFVPMLGLWVSFREVQKLYAFIGAWFMPLLTILLLIMNSRADWVGERYRNRWPTILALLLALAFFGWTVWSGTTPS